VAGARKHEIVSLTPKRDVKKERERAERLITPPNKKSKHFSKRREFASFPL
jgi:hypothetical protein